MPLRFGTQSALRAQRARWDGQSLARRRSGDSWRKGHSDRASVGLLSAGGASVWVREFNRLRAEDCWHPERSAGTATACPCSPRTEGPAGTASLSAWPRYKVKLWLPNRSGIASSRPPCLACRGAYPASRRMPLGHGSSSPPAKFIHQFQNPRAKLKQLLPRLDHHCFRQ